MLYRVVDSIDDLLSRDMCELWSKDIEVQIEDTVFRDR